MNIIPRSMVDDGSSAVFSTDPQAAVAQLGQAALTQDDLDFVFEMAVELVCHVLDLEYAKILHQPADGEPFELMAGCGWKDHVRVGETTVPADADSQAGYTLLSAAVDGTPCCQWDQCPDPCWR